MGPRVFPLFAMVLGLLLAAPASAFAADASAQDDKSGGLSAVELPPFFAPMIVNGKLENYAYITIALMPASPAKVVDIRAKVAFLQDAFLREVNHGTIAKDGDPNTVDVDALKPRLLERMNTVLPAGTVTDLKFNEVSITSLRGK